MERSRKRVRHFHEPGHLHELTFSCYHRWPLLTNNRWYLGVPPRQQDPDLPFIHGLTVGALDS